MRRRQWHPTPVLLPGKSHGRRSLVGCSPWGRYDWVTLLSLFTFMHWGRKWQPTPVFLPGESQGRGSLAGCPSMGSHRVGHDWSDLAAAAAAAAAAAELLWLNLALKGKGNILKLFKKQKLHIFFLRGPWKNTFTNISFQKVNSFSRSTRMNMKSMYLTN